MLQLREGGNNLDLIKEAASSVYSDNEHIRDLSICQAILEGGVLHRPPSWLALKYNNLFGIKGTGTNGSIAMMTHEFEEGELKLVSQPFAWNHCIEDSFAQHRKVLKLSRYQNLWTATNFNDVAKLVKEDGYTTDPEYDEKLIQLYNQYLNNSLCKN